ncbi:MAG: hypothetical protein ACLSA6_08635 [Holdemania massiliensis]
MAEVASEVFVLREGRCEWLESGECGFSYRTSIFKSSRLGDSGGAVSFARRIRQNPDLMDRRRHEGWNLSRWIKPSAGSVFPSQGCQAGR